jgi:hypothetical protein
MRLASSRVQKPGTNYTYRDYQTSLFGGDHAWLWMAHGYAMTIADYIAFGVLIAFALWAGAMLYLRGKL